MRGIGWEVAAASSPEMGGRDGAVRAEALLWDFSTSPQPHRAAATRGCLSAPFARWGFLQPSQHRCRAEAAADFHTHLCASQEPMRLEG